MACSRASVARICVLRSSGSVAASGPFKNLCSSWAVWPFEYLLLPRRHVLQLPDLMPEERDDLSAILKRCLVRYDNLWQMSFPNVLAIHQAPTDCADYSAFHFHIECHPPLRKPHLLKYLAGPEIGGGNFLSDTRPEAKAAELRAVPDIHYRLSSVGPHA